MRGSNSAVRINPLNVEAYHNRAVIFERKGNVDEAVEQYRTSLQYNPQCEPSRRALLRLVGTADVRGPKNDKENQALLMDYSDCRNGGSKR